ncbi:hypothetical protein DLREEDagrD3_11620 [Denitratisoma sp. agr-D3]
MNDIRPPFSDPLTIPDLLVRPTPGRSEGPQGYLLRLAEANCLSLHELKQLGARYAPVWLQQNHLLPSAALDPDLHAHVHRMAELVQDKGRIWNQRLARFCPQCLMEAPVWQASWELMFHDACPHHGVWLVDQCTSCGQPIPWRREHLLRCPCGADLRQENLQSAPDSVLRLAGYLENRLLGRDTGEDFPVLSGMNLEQVQRLVRYLGGYMDPISGPKPLKLRQAFSMQASWPVSSLAAEILVQWPQAFENSWTRMQGLVEGDKVGLKGAFKQAHYYLYKGLSEAAFSPVRDAFEQWLSQHWKGGLSKRNRLAEQLLAKAQWIPAQAAAREIGVSPNKLRAMVRDGFLEGQESVSSTGRQFMVVRRDQLDGVLAQLDNEITMNTAMEMLGLGKLRMRRILKLLFPTARRVAPRGPMPWCVPRNEVEALLALTEGLPVETIPEEHQVALGHVLRYWTWTTEHVATLVEVVKSGSVKPQSVLEGVVGLSGWVFDRAQLKTWWSGLNKGKLTWMTIPEMARYLAIKQQMAYWLCQNGYVSAEKLGNARELGSRVRIEDVERFRQTHVYRRDMAASLRTSSKKLGNLLAEVGIFPIRGHTVMPPRLAVYAVTDELRRFLADLMGVRPSELQLGSKMGANASRAELVGLSNWAGNSDGSFS